MDSGKDNRETGGVGRQEAREIMGRMADRGIIRVGTPRSAEEAVPPAELLILEEYLATGKDPRDDPESEFYRYDFHDQGRPA